MFCGFPYGRFFQRNHLEALSLSDEIRTSTEFNHDEYHERFLKFVDTPCHSTTTIGKELFMVTVEHVDLPKKINKKGVIDYYLKKDTRNRLANDMVIEIKCHKEVDEKTIIEVSTTKGVGWVLSQRNSCNVVHRSSDSKVIAYSVSPSSVGWRAKDTLSFVYIHGVDVIEIEGGCRVRYVNVFSLGGSIPKSIYTYISGNVKAISTIKDELLTAGTLVYK